MTPTPPPHIVDVDGADIPNAHRAPMNVKQFVFDWSGILAVAGVCVGWGAMSSRVQTVEDEIRRLRSSNDSRAVTDVQIAATMATKQDVQRVSDQVQALAAELRNARIGR